MLLTRRYRDVQGSAIGICDGMNFCRDATSGPPNCIFFGPPLPPHESWWARTTEPSTMEPSSSLEIASALNTAPQTPRLDHSEKRLNAVFQLPKRSGRSLHGAPVLAIHTTALMKFLSPREDRRPAPEGSVTRMVFHWSSLSSWRRIESVDQTLPSDATAKNDFSVRREDALRLRSGRTEWIIPIRDTP